MEWIMAHLDLCWFIVGCLLIIVEIASNTAVILFFGAGALTAAVGAWLGLGFNWQLAVFIIASVISLLIFRKKFKVWLNKSDQNVRDDFIGQQVLLLSNFNPGEPGEVELNGVGWKAVSDKIMYKGQWATIIEQKGIALIIEPLKH